MKQNSIYSGDLILVNASHEFRTEDKSILVPVDDQFSNILVNKKLADAYQNITMDRICAYTKDMFSYWTEGEFSSDFRKMLTLEQYRDPKMAQLYQMYLATGPLEYMAAIFRKLTDSDAAAMQMALEFYGPMYLLYSVYDAAEHKESVISMLETHIDQFIRRVHS